MYNYQTSIAPKSASPGYMILQSLCIAIAIAAIYLLASGSLNESKSLSSAACILPFLSVGRLHSKAGEHEGGGGLSEQKFQSKVIGALDTMSDEQKKAAGTVEDLVTNFDNLQGETKSAFEELTALKNKNKGLDSDMTSIQLALKKVNLMLSQEQRAAYGSFGKAVANDPERAKVILRNVAQVLGVEQQLNKAIGEDSGVGATLINDEFHSDIYDALSRYGKWSTLGVKAMGTRDGRIPVKTSRPTAGFILAEGGEIADDTNKAGVTKTLEAELVGVLLNVSKQLIEDGEIDVVADVMDDFVEAVNLALDTAMFRGDGTEDYTNGGITGLFNFGTAVVAETGRQTIAQTKYQDWLRCLTSVNDVVLERPACWWINPTMLASAIGVQDENGRPIFQTALEAPGAGVASLFGFPIKMVSAAPNVDAAGSQIAAFGDPRAFAVGVRKKFSFDASDDARFSTYERSFRGIARADGVGLEAAALSVLSTAT